MRQTYDIYVGQNGYISRVQMTWGSFIGEPWTPVTFRTVADWIDLALRDDFDLRRIHVANNPTIGKTVAGIGPGGWDSGKLAESQQAHADRLMAESINLFKPPTPKATSVAYRLYTEGAESLRESLLDLIERYFEGATITYGVGLWQGTTEIAAVVDIIGTTDDLQAIASLAGDIRFVHGQSAVLVTWSNVNQLLITGDANV